MKKLYGQSLEELERMGAVKQMSLLRRIAGRGRRATPRRAKHTRGRKPIEE
tara:strand:+ start:383 stop:535 length:153 start_codon:yes stop_codon:yes gene_type:complete